MTGFHQPCPEKEDVTGVAATGHNLGRNNREEGQERSGQWQFMHLSDALH